MKKKTLTKKVRKQNTFGLKKKTQKKSDETIAVQIQKQNKNCGVKTQSDKS